MLLAVRRLGSAVSTPLVSIIITNFNYARYLTQSIGSALSQTYPNLEVVVVDDASVDDSRDIIRAFDGRIVPVLRERNGGHGAAFNAGFSASRGEIVVFLDADDYLYPGAVARVLSEWRPGISKVQFRLDLVDVGGRKLDLYPAPEVLFDSGDVLPRMLTTGRYETAVTSGNAFPRGTLEKILPVPETEFEMGAEAYLVTLAPFNGPIVSLDEPLGAYRQHGSNAWKLDHSAPGKHLRRSLEHDARKYDALRVKARQLGMKVARALGMRDHQHLSTRLASLSLEPSLHPYANDRRGLLALRGAVASLDARLPWKRRAILAGWFMAAGFLPRTLAQPAILWRLAPDFRPPAVDRFLKGVRSFVR
jgi:glycosyltransferase involved in cell wall biosynthesis